MTRPDLQSAIDDALESLRAEWRRPALDLTSGPWTVTNAVAPADEFPIPSIPRPEWDASWPLPPLPLPGLMPR